MRSDAPEKPEAPADLAAAKSAFTVSGTGTAPPAPVRRGRGTFGRQLRTEDMERQQQAHLSRQRDGLAGCDTASSIMTSATTAVVLQPTTLHIRTIEGMVAPEDEAAAPNAQKKKNIPLETVYMNPTAALTAAAAAAAHSNDPKQRELFGMFHEEPADTTRQLFFRGEKRKRYCVVVGNLQSVRRQVTLKLFGHRGLKPFKLQGKMIRLINLSVGRPRMRRVLLNPDGTQRVNEQGEVVTGEFDDLDEEDEEEEEVVELADVTGDAVNSEEGSEEKKLKKMAQQADGQPSEPQSPAGAAVVESEDPEELEAKRRAHEAAGFPAEERRVSSSSSSSSSSDADADAEEGTQGAAPPSIEVDPTQPQPQQEPQQPSHDSAAASGAEAPLGFEKEAEKKPLVPSHGGDEVTPAQPQDQQQPQLATAKVVASPPVPIGGDADVSLHNSNGEQDQQQQQPQQRKSTSAENHPSWAAEEAMDEDVDHYFERADDEVVPLTVQRVDDDGAGTAMGNEALSLANSPVLTARYFASLTDHFLREFRFLLSLEDVRQQNVSVNVNLGAAYCCLARHGSHSTPLKHATFSQFVERMNDESMQLYFIKDCPTCVSRAVDRECGALDHESAITMVKIHFFSNERQSRSIARAVWDTEKNAFKLLDMENVGVSFNWSVFSLDETLIRQRTAEAMKKAIAESPSAEAAAAAEAKAARAKSVAYPFEVEFRAFRRWRQHADHPAAPLAEAILEMLSIAEHGLISHGSSAGYEHLDLSSICELDYAAEDVNVESITVEHTSRVKPQGTDLIVDNTTSLFIENFAAARQLKEQVEQYGPEKAAARQNISNNNYLRGRGGGGGRRGDGGDRGYNGMNRYSVYDEEFMRNVLQPAWKLTFFRSRGSTIHWKFRLGSSVEENIAPMAEALRFVQQVLVTANDIERSYDRGGAAPEAL